MEPLLPRILPEGERKREEFFVLVGVSFFLFHLILGYHFIPKKPGGRISSLLAAVCFICYSIL
jgi:hypothetical protein